MAGQSFGPPEDPSRDPDELSTGANSPLTPPSQVSPHGRLIEQFESKANHSGWTILDEESRAAWVHEWAPIIRMAIFEGRDQCASLYQDRVNIRILKVARDNDAVYCLTCLEDGSDSFFLDEDEGLGCHVFGAASGRLIALSESLPSAAALHALEHGDAEDAGIHSLCLIDRRSLALEARAFSVGEMDGFVGTLFRSELEELGIVSEGIWDISASRSTKGLEGSHAFLCRSESGVHLYLEMGLDEVSSILGLCLSPPLEGSSRYDTPLDEPLALSGEMATASDHTLESFLSSLEYHRVSLSPQSDGLSPHEFFRRDLQGIVSPWVEGKDATIVVRDFYQRPSDPEDALLIHVQMRNKDQRGLIPFFGGSESACFEEDVDLAFEARWIRDSSTEAHYRYRPRLIQLPKELSVQQFVSLCLPELPHSWLGSALLSKVIDETQSEGISFVRHRPFGQIIPPPREEESLFEGTTVTSLGSFARLLCFSSLGAHAFSVATTKGRIIDLRLGVTPRHFLPEVAPFDAGI